MFSVILLAAGSGTRMGMNKNKILLDLNGKPVFMYPIDTFSKFDAEIIMVINKVDEDEIRKKLPANVKLIYGGATRQESVYNGLLAATCDIVMVHDCARCLISESTIQACLEKLKDKPFVFVGHKVVNTIKLIDGASFETLNREALVSTETPQCGKRKIFLEAHRCAIKDNFTATDDMALIEKYTDEMIGLVYSDDFNFKLTTPIDFKLAELMVKK